MPLHLGTGLVLEGTLVAIPARHPVDGALQPVRQCDWGAVCLLPTSLVLVSHSWTQWLSAGGRTCRLGLCSMGKY
jgi:hypothetical protein